LEGNEIVLTAIQPDVQSIIIQWPDSASSGLEGTTADKVPT
jgi:hypothetical protein